MSSKYAEAGVDVKKRGIEIFQETISNLFPGAFCVVTKDPHLPKYGLVTHADSAGTKPIAAYLYWKETGDTQWFKGLAQDVLAMNVNDIACVGAEPINFVDYIAINPNTVPKTSLLKTINKGFKESLETLSNLGIDVLFSGGETADLPDVIRTLDVSGVVNGRVELSKIIIGAKIKPGDMIIGLRSGGKTLYENKENSGIMCNGLTLARHCLLSKEYRQKYPEISEPEGKGYQGRFKVDTYVDELQMTVGEALVSPMRFYAPIVLEMLEKHGEDITGLVHNMGGGMTKCLRIGTNINFKKDKIIKPDPVFHLIQRESGEDWKSMFEIFNMGTGFEIIAKPNATDNILEISEKHGLQAQVIGKCEKSSGQNKVSIISPWGKFQYQREQ
ncbi:phosphoribosylformylglycinamidine cyclo-ligase [Candidatus Bathyarchaeota archaeon]|nr:phosphoribosylformylglycinamidine cyclo-ligase [Candidatus Bathyarchaeota archaeon]